MLLYNHLWHNILHLPTNLQEKLRHNVFKGFAQRGDLFSHKDEPELFPHRILFWKAQNICSMGGISLDFMSDRPLGNLILSFLVISLWKTTINSFSSDIFMQKKKIPCANHLTQRQPTQRYSPKCLLPVLLAPPSSRQGVLLASLPVEIYSEPPRIGGAMEGSGYLMEAGSSAPFVWVVMSQLKCRLPQSGRTI